MSEEEKKAINFLLNVCADDCINDDTISIILNLINKLQKENEEYHRIKKDLIKVNKKIYDVETIDEFIKTISKLQEENKELKEKLHEKNMRIIKLNKLLGGLMSE